MLDSVYTVEMQPLPLLFEGFFPTEVQPRDSDCCSLLGFQMWSNLEILTSVHCWVSDRCPNSGIQCLSTVGSSSNLLWDNCGIIVMLTVSYAKDPRKGLWKNPKHQISLFIAKLV